jgi:hypothetical protein
MRCKYVKHFVEQYIEFIWNYYTKNHSIVALKSEKTTFVYIRVVHIRKKIFWLNSAI